MLRTFFSLSLSLAYLPLSNSTLNTTFQDPRYEGRNVYQLIIMQYKHVPRSQMKFFSIMFSLLFTESLLTDNECPHKVKSDLINSGSHCTFAFKRIDAKIAWPILSWSTSVIWTWSKILFPRTYVFGLYTMYWAHACAMTSHM